jgi:hypothetical protein
MKRTLLALFVEIQSRELSMERLKRFVSELDDTKDRKRLERKTSLKSRTLYSMVGELTEQTNNLVRKIGAFLGGNKKYFTRDIFCYQGTDLLKSMQKEVQEINEIVRVIKNEDDDMVYKLETTLFNGVMVDNQLIEKKEEEKLIKGKAKK